MYTYIHIYVCVIFTGMQGKGCEERKLAGELREDQGVCRSADKGSGSRSELV